MAVSFQQACIDSANHLIELCELASPRISSISEINSAFFVALFERITGLTIPDLVPSIDSIAEVHNVQAVIDTLSLDVLSLSLSHISGENVASGDPLSVLNLLEVLEAVFPYLFPKVEQNHRRTRTSSKKRKVPSSFESKSSLESAPPIDSENVVPVKISRRGICKRTLKKLCKDEETEVEIPPSPISTVFRTHIPKKRHRNILSPEQNGVQKKESIRRKKSQPQEKHLKHPTNDDVECLYKSNFEKKLRNLLMGDNSPYPKCHQLKQNYLKDLRTPLKRKPIPACRKSFLLPQNLRHPSSHSKAAKIGRRKPVPGLPSKVLGTSAKKEEPKSESDSPAIIRCLLGEFPGFELPPNTLELMKRRYHQHLSHVHKQLQNTLHKKPTALKQAEEAAAKQHRLSNILTKDLKQKQFLKEVQEARSSANYIRGGLRDARLRSAKMKQYFEKYHIAMRNKMQQRNFTEEMIVERTFQEMLNLQKQKVQLLCQHVRETDREDARRHRQYLEALQHTYEQQLDLIAESLAMEQREALEADREKNWVARKMSRELRDKLQKDVRSLQKDVLDLMRDTHFRELDAQNFIASIP